VILLQSEDENAFCSVVRSSYKLASHWFYIVLFLNELYTATEPCTVGEQKKTIVLHV
jgi:hypothetical protein